MKRRFYFAIALLSAVAALTSITLLSARAADDAAKSGASAPAEQTPPSGSAIKPLERTATTEKGLLKNPLTLTPEIVAEGKALYREKTCSACHGPDGGGIHCPSLANQAWVYGSDDDTLFRLVTLGSDELLKQGYVRGDKEIFAGPMPGFSEALQDETQLWKILAFIRSVQTGGAEKDKN